MNMSGSVGKIADGISKVSVKNDGVSFQGKSLKLNTEKDCDEVVEAIKSCKNLEYLNLEGNTLGVEAADAISKALKWKPELKRALWKDMFTGRMKDEIPMALEHLGNGLTFAGAQLTELDLSDNAFGPIGVQGLVGLLSSEACYQLQELKLNNNGLGISGGKMLAKALLKCHEDSLSNGKGLQLKLLVAGRNRLENDGATALAEVFGKLGTLEEICMPQNGIYHKGIKALSDSFKKNPNLKVIDLNDNTVTEKGANHIAKALPNMQKLRVLNLGDCLLKTGGATVLAKALTEKHSELEELNLGYNEIKSEGGIAVAKAMSNKHKLKQLNINGNMFGTEGRNQLKKNLENDKRLPTLGTLSGDETCDEDESEPDDDTEDEEENVSEEEGIKANGFSLPPEKSENIKLFGPITERKPKDETSEFLTNILADMSIKAQPTGTLKTFLDHPSSANLLNVKEEQIIEFISKNQDSSVDFLVETFIPLLVKVSSFITCSNPEVSKLSSSISGKLYKDLFRYTSEKKKLPLVNNTLFVYFGLIKSEDKNFKINWDVQGSLEAFKKAAKEGSVPQSTLSTFEFLIKAESNKGKIQEITLN